MSRLTILVPLHAASPWVHDVSANLAHIPPAARVVLSDVTAVDDALARLERIHNRDSRLRFRRDNGPAGWRLHINALLDEVDSELFAVLPQDDRICPGYYERLVAALDRNPTAGLAYGPIDAVEAGKEVSRLAAAPFRLGVRKPWREILELDRDWNLGIPFRGVWRSCLVRPIPQTPGDRFADQLWVLSLGLVAHLVEVPEALYEKRYHARNTHGGWVPLRKAERRAVIEQEIHVRLDGDLSNRDAALALLRRRPSPTQWRQAVGKVARWLRH